MSAVLESELVSVGSAQAKNNAKASIDSLTDEEQKIIDETANVPAEVWFSLSKWAKETNNFKPWLRSMLFSVGSIIGRGKKPSIKQSKHALKALADAKIKGFVVK